MLQQYSRSRRRREHRADEEHQKPKHSSCHSDHDVFLRTRIITAVRTIDARWRGFLIHLNARAAPVWQCEINPEETPVTTSAIFVVIVGVLVFAAFAGALAWTQLYARTPPAQVPRAKRRPF